MRDRRIRPEVLDQLADDQAAGNLHDLTRINRYFGGHSIGVDLLRELSPPPVFRVLDVGSASGDHGRAIESAIPGAKVTSLDRLERNLRPAAAPRVAADAFQLPFSDGSFDYVYCSLFLHHFEDKEIVELLRGFRRVARRAVVVVDLHRHGFSRWFLRATQPVFGWDAVTVSDGEISVEAGFRPSELRQLADQAGLDQARVRMHWPWFRLSVVSSV